MPREFTIRNLPAELRRVQGRIERATVLGLRTAAKDARAEVVEQINNQDPPLVDLGELKRSPQVTKVPNGAVLEVTAPHAAVQEFGTRPFTPPLEKILAWARRKVRGMKIRGKGARATKERAARQLAGRVWVAIRRRGIREKRYYREAQESFDEFVDRRIRERLARVKS
jgi:hypothetical protein